MGNCCGASNKLSEQEVLMQMQQGFGELVEESVSPTRHCFSPHQSASP
jgi:hypothetical protein